MSKKENDFFCEKVHSLVFQNYIIINGKMRKKEKYFFAHT